MFEVHFTIQRFFRTTKENLFILIKEWCSVRYEYNIEVSFEKEEKPKF